LQTEIKRLKLGHTWTTTCLPVNTATPCIVRYTNQGISGVGEGAPIVRYHEDAEGARQTVEAAREFLSAADPWQFQKLMQDVFRKIDGQYAAKASIDIALLDWIGKKLNVPLYRFRTGSSSSPR
jgi:L-Ala-D/L-Glu epimerase